MNRVVAGRYELDVEIGRGAIGTVWRARDNRSGDFVAVKMLQPEAAHDPEIVQAFLREAEVLGELDHIGIVRPRDVVANDDGFALVMDLIAGVDLRRQLRFAGTLPPADAVGLVAQVADALASVHAAGIVHGDIKPGNILVPRDGGPVRLVDFGVAHRVQRPSGGAHGTPEYVAPEVIDNVLPTPASDVYGLGILLYELVAGRSPFRGGPVPDVLRRHATCQAVLAPGMPEVVWQVVSRCLTIEAAGRPGADEVAARLREIRPSLAGMPPLPAVPEDVVTYRPRAAGGFGDPWAMAETVVSVSPPTLAVPGAAEGARPAPPSRSSARSSARSRSWLPGVVGAAAAAVLVALLLGALFVIGAGQEGGRDPAASGDRAGQPSTSRTPSKPVTPSPNAEAPPDETTTSPEQPGPPDPSPSADRTRPSRPRDRAPSPGTSMPVLPSLPTFPGG